MWKPDPVTITSLVLLLALLGFVIYMFVDKKTGNAVCAGNSAAKTNSAHSATAAASGKLVEAAKNSIDNSIKHKANSVSAKNAGNVAQSVASAAASHKSLSTAHSILAQHSANNGNTKDAIAHQAQAAHQNSIAASLTASYGSPCAPHGNPNPPIVLNASNASKHPANAVRTPSSSSYGAVTSISNQMRSPSFIANSKQAGVL